MELLKHILKTDTWDFHSNRLTPGVNQSRALVRPNYWMLLCGAQYLFGLYVGIASCHCLAPRILTLLLDFLKITYQNSKQLLVFYFP